MKLTITFLILFGFVDTNWEEGLISFLNVPGVNKIRKTILNCLMKKSQAKKSNCR
jgi:hypothetical protein